MSETEMMTALNEDLDLKEVEIEEIKKKIYSIRGKQVILDNDVAKLYEVETKKLNQAVKRNVKRFPKEFCFQLTEYELSNLRSQFVTSSLKKSNYGGRRYLPYAFTEQGVSMLSAVLHSDKAIDTSIKIINAFIEMRKIMLNNSQIFDRLTNVEYKMLEHDKKFEEVFNQFHIKDNVKQKIFFEGQIYDAYSMIIDLIKKAEEDIILIDNYVDTNTLNILAKKIDNVTVTIYTKSNTKLTIKDVNKFNKQYPILELKHTDRFHDRFLILDRNLIYHIGASIKDIGKKCFCISLIKDKSILESLISNIQYS